MKQMTFDKVIGQYRVKNMISSALDRKRLSHAYLFHGPPGVGKDVLALRIAMGLNCMNGHSQGCGECAHCNQIQKLEYPSFRMILPLPSRPKSMNQEKYNTLVREKTLDRIENPYREISFAPEITSLTSIGIDQIRTLKHDVVLKQQSGQSRVFIISHAEQMTVPAANSLLKLLEEPPPGTTLFLTTSAPGRILPTITSRCQTIRFDVLSEVDIEKALTDQWQFDEDNAQFFSRMSGGSIQRALEMADKNFEQLRTAAWDFLTISLQGNHIKRLDICDTMIQSHEKAGMHYIFQLLLAWLRDLLCLKAGVPEKIINQDRETVLENFLLQYEDLNLESALLNTEHAIASLKKNVYLNLIVHTLSQQLNRLATKRYQP